MVVLDRSWIPRPLRPLLSALWRSLEAALVRRADLTIAAHDSVMRQFDGGRVITVQNFPIMEDAVAVREVAVAKRPPRVLYHGDLTEQRGLLTMIDAIAQVNSVQAPELRLAGSLAPALRARLNGMPGMQRTRHLGWLDPAQLARSEERRVGKEGVRTCNSRGA